MIRWAAVFVAGAILLGPTACGPPVEQALESPAESPAELFRVGTLAVDQSDLDYMIQEEHGGQGDADTRAKAVAELTRRARFVQAAIDAKLADDPAVRAEVARLLAARFRETAYFPRLQKRLDAITEARLEELYEAQRPRFWAEEKRRVAVLWLDPGPDPARVERYEVKLARARDWVAKRGDSAGAREKGFSVLAVDHSEHAATRFKGGVLGWVERGGGANPWNQVVSRLAFEIDAPGDLSPVVTAPEGIFLVRLLEIKGGVQRSFESVRGELEREERARLREMSEAEFETDLERRYPVAIGRRDGG